MQSAGKIGVVAIGRNEGERLRRSLRSLEAWKSSTVYVDSGSTDDSVVFARGLGVTVVELDTSIPFTAGRARNAGFERLLQLFPDVEGVQFVDGDCEVVEGWIETANSVMAENPALGVVCGRRRERFPEATPWNRLCDMEWNTPVGRAASCGGDALYRVSALRASGPFDGSLVAGEEPELCVRIRAHGFEVRRIDADMTIHDAAMTHCSQWWRRASRNGHAIAGGLALHGFTCDHDWGRQLFRAVWWVAAIVGASLAAIASAFTSTPVTWKIVLGVLPIVLWLAILWRTYRGRRARGDSVRDCALYAFFVVLGKVPECLGAFTCWRDRVRGRRSHWIEYKPVPASAEVEQA